MKTRSIFLFVLALLTSCYCQAQSGYKNTKSRPSASTPASYKMAYSEHDFKTIWIKVDSLTNLGQPKSALALVNSIYEKAKTESITPQFIKSVIYRIRLNSDFQEDFLVNTLRDLNHEIVNAAEPGRQILVSIRGEVYWKYYRNNSYRFQDRTQIRENKTDSLQTWDLKTIMDTIAANYMASLDHDSLLKKIPIRDFSAILEKPDLPEKQKNQSPAFRPSLFDFLAHRALEFFSSAEDTSQQTAIKILSNLTEFHLKDKNPQAYIDVELDRLAFLHEKSILPGKDSLYLESLKKLEKEFASSPWSTDISFAMANFLYTFGQQYDPLHSDRYKWNLRNSLEICREAVKRFPDSEGGANCRNLIKTIEGSSLQITTEYAVPVEKPSLAFVKYKNLKILYNRLIKLDPESYSDQVSALNQEQLFNHLASQPVVRSWSVELPCDGDFQQHSVEIKIPGATPGFYVLLSSEDQTFTNHEKAFTHVKFWSTRISYISQRNPDGGIGVYVLDRVSGKPLKKVMVEKLVKNYNYTSRKYTIRSQGKGNTDENGFILLPPVKENSRSSSIYLKIIHDDDIFLTDGFYQYPVSETVELPVLQTSFFTDRAIYRPGQPVYFKGIILQKSEGNWKIKPGLPTKVIFSDVNGQKISEQSFTTNDFGSFNGSFTAPRGVLLGAMTIANESGSVSVSVEEYKRPTFDVICDPLEGNYKLGETIHVTGEAQAFAGNPLDGAQVKYRVVRAARFPWWNRYCYYPLPSSPELELINGTTKTDAQGKFSIDFTAIPDFSVPKENKPVFDYQIFVDVTDINGETQLTEQIVSVGYLALLLNVNLPEMVDLAKDSIFKIATTNCNGRSTPAMVTIKIERLHQPNRAFKPRQWDRPDLFTMSREEFHQYFPYDIYGDEDDPLTWKVEETLLETGMNTETDSMINLPLLTRRSTPGNLKQGSYRLHMKANDPYGETLEKTIYFTIYNPSSKELPLNRLNWFVPSKTSGEPGEIAKFLIGSKEDDVNVIYEIRVHDKLESRQWIKLSDQQKVIEIPIREEYRGNFSVNFVFIKLNRAFQNSQMISVPYSDKKLNIAIETFRNKLDPGQKEEWKIRITRPDKKETNAEFLAAMYDASLDLFRMNSWSFDIYQRYFSNLPWDINNAFHTGSGTWFPSNFNYTGTITRQYDQLNWFGLNYFGGGGYHRYKKGSSDRMILTAESAIPPVVAEDQVVQDEIVGGAVPDSAEKKSIPVKAEITPVMQIRKDFRETAFFYPTLVTDSTGNLILKFSAPESLTKWKILGFAHTKDLNYGLLEKELVTQKELMVFPNVPRFVRQGDTVIFSTKIVSLSDRDLSGEIKYGFFDALTMKSLDGAGNSFTSVFQVPRDGSTVISCKIHIPEDPLLSMLQFRVSASAGSFSDGEERIIPVLTNRMLVTETLPMPVRGKGTFEFILNKLFQSEKQSPGNRSLKNYRLTLEFATNPAWYAIQALPSLNEKRYENADAVFAAFYSNSLASFIANSDPKIKAVFESWKNITPDALLSNLEKNQQLKSAQLLETPWVVEAQNESERKQKLGQYFDLNTINANLEDNLKKMIQLQTPNGGWSWFEGMPESRFISQSILTGLGHLDHLGITRVKNDPQTWKMVVNAIHYLDGELQEDLENLKKYSPDKMNENHLGPLQIQYLYARSYFMGSSYVSKGTDPASCIPELSGIVKEAYNFYLEQAGKYWLQQDRYPQGMIALALNRLGKTDISGLILKSLSEKALHSAEMGMYWAQQPSWYWYQAPIETQAMMIETFDEVGKDSKSVEEMKIWLLKQKQTQDWRTPRATVEACYALLLRGTGLLSTDPGVKITLGKEKINSDKLIDTKKEAGTGYFQLSWSGSEINPDMGKINITKSSDGVAWGAIYWQYFEDLDKITPSSTPLKLDKKLFVERNTPKGPVLDPVDNNQLLKVGDKLKVRIVLTVDRNFEFVHMKDMRASAFEPYLVASLNVPGAFRDAARSADGLSGYRYQDGLGYYQSTTDAATNFFFDYLPKGTYVFEYPLKVNAAGDYSNGITTIQCMYAPEFSAHSEGIRVMVK